MKIKEQCSDIPVVERDILTLLSCPQADLSLSLCTVCTSLSPVRTANPKTFKYCISVIAQVPG